MLQELDSAASGPIEISGLHLVAGVDISFFERSLPPPTDPSTIPNGCFANSDHKAKGTATAEEAIGALVILAYPSLQVVHTVIERVKLSVPYVPTYLGFREAPVYQALFAQLPTQFWPNVVLVDGNGLLHPRGIGSAVHLGVALNIPTIGVAKSLLRYDDHTPSEKEVKTVFHHHPEMVVYPLVRNGHTECSELEVGGSAMAGVALRSQPLTKGTTTRAFNQAANPVFVSQGHRVSLTTAIRLVRACSRLRIPEPIRQADLQSRQAVRDALLRIDG